MKDIPFIIERTYNAPIAKVWNAITDKNEMKHWYFDLKEFQPVVGFEFEFTAGGVDDVHQYVHLCKVTEVIPGKKIAYSWTYKGYAGYSVVSFELFEEGKQTRLKLTHTGLDTFPQHIMDFARSNFEQGWTSITGSSLKQYVENEQA